MIRTLYGALVALVSFVYLAYLLRAEGVTTAKAIRDALLVTLPIVAALVALWTYRSRNLSRFGEAAVIVMGILSAIAAIVMVVLAPF